MVQSAMVLPFLTGFLIWRDRVDSLDVAALCLILGSITLFGRAHTGRSAGKRTAIAGPLSRTRATSWLPIAVTAFLFVGLQQVLHTMPSRWPGWDDTAQLRVPLAMTGTLAAFAAVLLFQREWPNRRSWLPAAFLALCVVPSHVLLYRGLDSLAVRAQAGLGYPVAVGTCVVVFAVYSLGVLREPTTREHLVGLVLGIAGVVLMAT